MKVHEFAKLLCCCKRIILIAILITQRLREWEYQHSEYCPEAMRTEFVISHVKYYSTDVETSKFRKVPGELYDGCFIREMVVGDSDRFHSWRMRRRGSFIR
jgi:hypothetical protein